MIGQIRPALGSALFNYRTDPQFGSQSHAKPLRTPPLRNYQVAASDLASIRKFPVLAQLFEPCEAEGASPRRVPCSTNSAHRRSSVTPACAPGLPSVPPQSSQSWPISSSPILFHRCNSAPRANTTSAVPCLPLRGHDTHPDSFPQISISLFTTWVHLLFLFNAGRPRTKPSLF